jgi:hypothetical protein
MGTFAPLFCCVCTYYKARVPFSHDPAFSTRRQDPGRRAPVPVENLNTSKAVGHCEAAVLDFSCLAFYSTTIINWVLDCVQIITVFWLP